MGVCTHKEVYPTDEVLSSLSELEMSTTGTVWDAGKGLTRSSGSLGCGNGRLTIETICGGPEYGTGRAGTLCTGIQGDTGVQDDAADWCEGVVEEDVTDDMAGDNHCAESWDGVDLVCDDDGVTCWVWAQGRDCPTGASLLLLCTLPAQAMVPPLTISCPNDVTFTYVDLGALPWLNVKGWCVVEERGLDDDGSELRVLMGWAGNDETSECWTSLSSVATVRLPTMTFHVSGSIWYPLWGVIRLSLSQNCMTWGRASSRCMMLAIFSVTVGQPGSCANCLDAMVSMWMLDQCTGTDGSYSGKMERPRCRMLAVQSIVATLKAEVSKWRSMMNVSTYCILYVTNTFMICKWVVNRVEAEMWVKEGSGRGVG